MKVILHTAALFLKTSKKSFKKKPLKTAHPATERGGLDKIVC